MKRFAFLGFEVKTVIFFSFLEKEKSHVIKRDWHHFCCDHHRLRICRCFSEEREREREDEDDGKGSDDESEEEEDRSERFMGRDCK